ncbi:hypothetical protein F4823DRAFT_569368 [Ustulina deusta]|nr:hypothetical protein F4823DRAFT_569368 [Ustulina deusta]
MSRNFSLFLDRIAGPTIATVPVCIRLDHNAQINELLLQIQSQSIDMLLEEEYIYVVY